MSQEKDDKSKASGKAENAGTNDASKRPYATIDGKATEIPSVAGSAGKPAAAVAATPVSPAASSNAGNAPSSTTSAKPTAASPMPGASAKPSAVSGPGTTAKPTASPTPASVAKTSPSGFAVWLPSLISGATGAILALFGLGSLGLIGGDPNAAITTDRLAALEKSLTAKPAADQTKQLAATEVRVAAIEAAARDLAAAQAALIADAKALEARTASQSPTAAVAADRIQKLEQQLTELAAAANTDPQRGRIPALAQITTRLGDLDTQLTTRSATLKAELGQELEKRLSASAETSETARARLAQRTQSLETTLKSVADDTTALRSTVDGLKGDLEARFKSVAKPADVTAAIEPVTAKITGLEKNLAGVVRSEQDRNATAGNILLSIELGNLKRALDRGGRYTTELAAVKKVGGDKLNLAILETAQTTGVPSLAALTTEFRSLAYTMLDAEAVPTEGSVLDRMLAGAKSVIRVRKVVHGADDTSTEATIGRIEAHLKDARLGELLDEAKKLPDKPRVTAAVWLDKIKARFTIETALTDLEQSLKNALAGAADVKKGAN